MEAEIISDVSMAGLRVEIAADPIFPSATLFSFAFPVRLLKPTNFRFLLTSGDVGEVCRN